MPCQTRISLLFVLAALSACAVKPAKPTTHASAAPAPAVPAPVVAEPAPARVEEPPPPPKPKLPPATAVASFKVKDFDGWKQAFDEAHAARKAAGVLAHHVSRGVDQPRLVLLYLVGSDKDRLTTFVTSPELELEMKRGQLRGKPMVQVLTPVQTVPVTDATLPGVMITHEVADYDAWKNLFDEGAAARAQAGVLGESISRDAAQPNIVTVYLQGPDLDALKAYATSKELEQKMQAAGVNGTPEMLFVKGLEWKVYE